MSARSAGWILSRLAPLVLAVCPLACRDWGDLYGRHRDDHDDDHRARLVEVSMEVHPRNYRGHAPGLIQLTGHIRARQACVVRARILISSGGASPDRLFDFPGPGTRTVHLAVNFGADFRGWAEIEAFGPAGRVADRQRFSVDIR